MLPSSDFTITLRQSNDYARLVFIIHLFAMLVLLQSAIPVSLIITGFLVLLICMAPLVRSKIPNPKYQSLSYRAGFWLLGARNGKEPKYEQAYVSFDGGFFILLTLTGAGSPKTLVIFNDQLKVDQMRTLRLSSNANEKTLNSKKSDK